MTDTLTNIDELEQLASGELICTWLNCLNEGETAEWVALCICKGCGYSEDVLTGNACYTVITSWMIVISLVCWTCEQCGTQHNEPPIMRRL